MLIVAGTISVNPEHVDELRDACDVMVRATLQEAGCHSYSFSQSLTDPGTVQIFEIWQSPEELEAHFATPHMATFRRVLDGIEITDRDIHRYEVANIAKM